ncbi:hypothetical protein FB451DRAFT_1280031, partial [Mycena latifolia]
IRLCSQYFLASHRQKLLHAAAPGAAHRAATARPARRLKETRMCHRLRTMARATTRFAQRHRRSRLCGARARSSRSARTERVRRSEHGRPSCAQVASRESGDTRCRRAHTSSTSRARPGTGTGHHGCAQARHLCAAVLVKQRAAPRPTSRCGHAPRRVAGESGTTRGSPHSGRSSRRSATRCTPANNLVDGYEVVRSQQSEPRVWMDVGADHARGTCRPNAAPEE